jgi:hypothetical protein
MVWGFAQITENCGGTQIATFKAKISFVLAELTII